MAASSAKKSTPAKAIPFCLPWVDDAEALRVGEALRGRLAGDGPFGRKVENAGSRSSWASRASC